ncbi:MAG: hypothetical protein ACR2P7_06670 [bacterium]
MKENIMKTISKKIRNLLFLPVSAVAVAAFLASASAAADEHGFEYNLSVLFGAGTPHSTSKRGCDAAAQKALMEAAKYGDHWCTFMGRGTDVERVEFRECRYSTKARYANSDGKIVVGGRTGVAPASLSTGEATAISIVYCE